MKKILIICIFVGLLGACVTTQTQDEKITTTQPKRAYHNYNIPNSVDKAIKGLEGCTKEFAFEVMGLPTGERIVDGKKYFEWNIRKGYCIVNADIDANGIVEKIYYQEIKRNCQHMYLRITNYYYSNPAQNEVTCPNRTDLQGNHYIKERKK